MTSIKRVHVYGLGAIGSNLLIQLAKQKPELQYIGYDMDKVEARNVGPQAYFIEHIGQPKTAAMVTLLRRFLRQPKFYPVNAKVTTGVELNNDDLLLDCFDNTASRQLLCAATGHRLHIGFSPYYTAEMLWSPEYSVPNDIASGAPDLCTLPDATSFISFVVSAAAIEVVKFLETGEKSAFIVTGKTHLKSLL